MNLYLKKILFFGILSEILLLIVCYIAHPNLADTFRYAARYSGRLSAFIFLYTFYVFSKKPTDLKNNTLALNFIKLFAVLHLIHWCFLALSVYLNKVPLEFIKVIGGALAYILIIVAPFKLHFLKIHYQLVYFYYVSLVMILTYVARIKGDFEGATPSWFHYVMLGVFITSCIIFGLSIKKYLQQNTRINKHNS